MIERNEFKNLSNEELEKRIEEPKIKLNLVDAEPKVLPPVNNETKPN